MDLTKFSFTTSGKKKKKTKDEEESKEKKKKEYELKRQRTYLPSWEEEFLGLKYAAHTDDDGKVVESKPKTMMCQTCKDYPDLADRNCSMFIGTSAFRKDTLIADWKSNLHRKCEEKKKKPDEMKKLEAPGSGSFSQSGPLLSCVRKMEKKMKTK
ncbi:unnamed protein product [Mytilus coruscus]|uniref:Uncharacterized protein n=1 Tax=Mytilus coruscus TaxID=42192 RepID=A0A6J8E9K5_MYTCO|nr:unnamed protein product [Mytilus coruscus]